MTNLASRKLLGYFCRAVLDSGLTDEVAICDEYVVNGTIGKRQDSGKLLGVAICDEYTLNGATGQQTRRMNRRAICGKYPLICCLSVGRLPAGSEACPDPWCLAGRIPNLSAGRQTALELRPSD